MEESADEHDADHDHQNSKTANNRALNLTKHTEFGVPTSIISIDEPNKSTFRGEEDSIMLLVEHRDNMDP